MTKQKPFHLCTERYHHLLQGDCRPPLPSTDKVFAVSPLPSTVRRLPFPRYHPLHWLPHNSYHPAYVSAAAGISSAAICRRDTIRANHYRVSSRRAIYDAAAAYVARRHLPAAAAARRLPRRQCRRTLQLRLYPVKDSGGGGGGGVCPAASRRYEHDTTGDQ